jgi:hypothetical protein
MRTIILTCLLSGFSLGANANQILLNKTYLPSACFRGGKAIDPKEVHDKAQVDLQILSEPDGNIVLALWGLNIRTENILGERASNVSYPNEAILLRTLGGFASTRNIGYRLTETTNEKHFLSLEMDRGKWAQSRTIERYYPSSNRSVITNQLTVTIQFDSEKIDVAISRFLRTTGGNDVGELKCSYRKL